MVFESSCYTEKKVRSTVANYLRDNLDIVKMLLKRQIVSNERLALNLLLNKNGHKYDISDTTYIVQGKVNDDKLDKLLLSYDPNNQLLCLVSVKNIDEGMLRVMTFDVPPVMSI